MDKVRTIASAQSIVCDGPRWGCIIPTIIWALIAAALSVSFFECGTGVIMPEHCNVWFIK